MNLSVHCDKSPSYIGEIEVGRKFPSIESIQKIASVLKVEPYLFFKDPKANTNLSDNSNQLPSLPPKVKKQLKANIKKQLQTQIRTQITSQINLSLDEVLSEIDEILDSN